MSFKDFSISSSVGHFVKGNSTIFAILEETQGTFLCNYFEIGPLVLEEMSFKKFFYF